MPDGAKNSDSTRGASVSSTFTPRRACRVRHSDTSSTMIVHTTNRIDSEPCTAVLKTTACMSSAVFARPSSVFPAASASR